MVTIQKEMSIPEILEQYPNTKRVFERYGLYPERYKAMRFENITASALVHQIPLETLLSELNASLQ